MYIVLDLEFYHNSKKTQLGSIKQLGAFKFNDNYKIVDKFEMTITKYTTEDMLRKLFYDFIIGVDIMYVWAKNNDLKALRNIFDNNLEVHEIDAPDDFSKYSVRDDFNLEMDIIDVQEYFKDINLASLSMISEALSISSEGRHNAVIDAEITFEIVKHFDLNNEVSRRAIYNYVNLINSNATSTQKTLVQKAETKQEVTKQEVAKQEIVKQEVTKPKATRHDYKIVKAGCLRKLDNEYYTITTERRIKEIINSIKERKLPICKDGSFKLDSSLEQLVKNDAIIVFTNTKKLKSIRTKHEDKLIVMVDSTSKDNYLAIAVSRKVYKKFII